MVTCKRQPALGCVYKLVSINNEPRLKVSQTFEKMTIPGKKFAYRLFDNKGEPILDLMTLDGEDIPRVNERVLCVHPFVFRKRCYVTPSRVEPLLIDVCHMLRV